MVESISSCTFVMSSSLMCAPPEAPSLHLSAGTVYSRMPPRRALAQVLGLLLVLCPVGAHAQSPGWEELLSAAERAWDRGQVADAERLYLGAVTQAEAFSDADPRLARSLTALGLFYREQGRPREAAPILHRALSVTEKAVPPDDPRLIANLNNVGVAWLQQGLVSDAEPVFRRALAIAEKKLPPDDLATAASIRRWPGRSQAWAGSTGSRDVTPRRVRSTSVRS